MAHARQSWAKAGPGLGSGLAWGSPSSPPASALKAMTLPSQTESIRSVRVVSVYDNFVLPAHQPKTVHTLLSQRLYNKAAISWLVLFFAVHTLRELGDRGLTSSSGASTLLL